MNTPVNLETAELLFRILPDFESNYPTIADVVMWIYENHNIWISVDRYIDTEQSPDYRYGSCIYYDDHYYGYNHKNPTEAYEAAIKYCLEKII